MLSFPRALEAQCVPVPGSQEKEFTVQGVGSSVSYSNPKPSTLSPKPHLWSGGLDQNWGALRSPEETEKEFVGGQGLKGHPGYLGFRVWGLGLPDSKGFSSELSRNCFTNLSDLVCLVRRRSSPRRIHFFPDTLTVSLHAKYKKMCGGIPPWVFAYITPLLKCMGTGKPLYRRLNP